MDHSSVEVNSLFSYQTVHFILHITKWLIVGLSLASILELVAQPVQSFIQSVTVSGTGGLNNMDKLDWSRLSQAKKDLT